WMFMAAYRKLREKLLRKQSWHLIARLGAGAFETISGEVVNVALMVLVDDPPVGLHTFVGVDASEGVTASEKKRLLSVVPLEITEQAAQLRNIDARIGFRIRESSSLLRDFADSYLGLGTGDGPRYLRKFWEFDHVRLGWALYQSAVQNSQPYGGRDQVIA